VIQTPRLHLVPFELDHAVALAGGRLELGALLGVAIPDGWPHFPEAYSVEAFSTPEDGASARVWGTYLFLLNDRCSLVGSGGYKGKPVDGVVEVGYEVAPNFQNRGLATEATRSMVGHAFSYPQVELVQAHTLGEVNASTKVLNKVGMTFVEAISDPDHGVVWQWQISRSESPVPA
jgi:RimJ/RimL family protein N-acetyltransferase